MQSKKAENNLYNTPNRHLASADIEAKEAALQASIESFQNRMPSVFDPLLAVVPFHWKQPDWDAVRMVMISIRWHISSKKLRRIPAKVWQAHHLYPRRVYGSLRQGRSKALYREVWRYATSNVEIPNRLSFDVEFYAKKLLAMTEAEVGHLYPSDEKGNKPVAYYWARTATCSNPSCRAEVPLLKQFYLANTKSKKVYLNPIINETDIQFEIKQ